MPVNWVDVAVVVVVLVSGLIALLRGFVHEVLAVTAWVGATFVALYGVPLARPFVRPYIDSAWLADLAAGAAIFLVTLLILSLITHAVARQVRASALNSVDRSLGFVFGIARGAFLVCLAYMLGVWVLGPDIKGDKRPEWLASARTRPLMEYGAGLIQAALPEEYGWAEGKARATAESARKAAEAERTYRSLTSPRPRGSEREPPRGGYEPAERQELDQLFRKNQ